MKGIEEEICRRARHIVCVIVVSRAGGECGKGFTHAWLQKEAVVWQHNYYCGCCIW
jgi:hypothetical protein